MGARLLHGRAFLLTGKGEPDSMRWAAIISPVSHGADYITAAASSNMCLSEAFVS